MSTPVCTYEQFKEMVIKHAIKFYGGEKNKKFALEGVEYYIDVVKQRHNAFANNPKISLEGADGFAEDVACGIWEFY
ncbi:MAG: hypothetical protein ACI4UM_08890 [Succinivibrio sp.]